MIHDESLFPMSYYQKYNFKFNYKLKLKHIK